jgi:predicted polyphosphate/ATP-dependent NAD kinase
MSKVGIIANPASGKDIRRLVAYGTVIDNEEKVNIVKRVILGMISMGIKEILIMPDTFGIGDKAIYQLKKRKSINNQVKILEMTIEGSQEDSTRAAALMKKRGVKCIVVLGGDGTNRAVSKGCGSVPLIPISTGTNNVFPRFMEGTYAGIAAGLIANWPEDKELFVVNKRLVVIKNGKKVDCALVDAVVSRDIFIGARAVWDMEKVTQIVITRGEPSNIGLSSIGGYLYPIKWDEPKGLYIETGNNLTVRAPIAPGIVKEVGIKKYTALNIGDKVEVKTKPCTIALDGERELEFTQNDKGYIMLDTGGPRVVDVKKTLLKGVKNRIFIKEREEI